MQRRRIILISVVLVALIGVVMTEGEQEVDKLQVINNEPNNLELLKENTLTGERGDEQALYFSYLEVTMSCNIIAKEHYTNVLHLIDLQTLELIIRSNILITDVCSVNLFL